MIGNTNSNKRGMLVVSNMWPDETHPSFGIFVKRFVDQAESLGWDCDLAVLCSSDSKVGKVCGYLSFYASSFCKALFGRYDITYIHYPSFSAPAVLLARRIKKFKVIANVHGSDVLPVSARQRKMHRYTEMALACADRVVVPSEYFSGIVLEKYGLDAGRVFVYPSGGVDSEIFHPLPANRIESLKTELGLDHDLMTVCFAGRITEGKGWDTYLEAVAEIFSRGQRLNVLLVGSGDQDERCAALMGELGLDAGSIVRMGLQPQERLCELYNVADLFVFPGRRSESLGLVAIEAMACGTPVIASDYAAPRYYVKDGFNGVKVPKGDSGALADAMEALASNPIALRRLAEGALKEAERYSVRSVITTLAEILNEPCEDMLRMENDDAEK